MDNTDFITILAWMKQLKASLVEKMVFAIIYGFSKDRRSDFRGSRQYLAEWCECSTKTIDRALASLCDAGYIIKREEVVNDVRFCHYAANFDTLDKMSIPWTKCPGGREILSKNLDKLSHNNIDDNIDDNIATTRAREVADAPLPKKNKFSFEDSLVAAGATAQHVDALLAIRKGKRLTNTERAYNQLIEAVNTVCNRKGVTVDEVVAFMVAREWGGLNPDWPALENLRSKAKRTGVTMSIGDYINMQHNANK